MTVLCDSCSPRKWCTAEKNREKCKFYQPMTEQEYIQTCNTEQLADVLAKQKCDGCHDEPYDEKYGVCKYCMMKKKEQIMEWLKQPHREE